MHITRALFTIITKNRLTIPEQSIRRAALYRELGTTSAEVIRLAGLAPEPFGHQSERLLIRQLGLLPRLATDHDGICPSTGKRVEIKCARFALSSSPENLKYSWTRINITPDSGYDLILLAFLDQEGFSIQFLDKQQVLELAQRITTYKQLVNPRKITIRRDDIL